MNSVFAALKSCRICHPRDPSLIIPVCLLPATSCALVLNIYSKSQVTEPERKSHQYPNYHSCSWSVISSKICISAHCGWWSFCYCLDLHPITECSKSIGRVSQKYSAAWRIRWFSDFPQNTVHPTVTATGRFSRQIFLTVTEILRDRKSSTCSRCSGRAGTKRHWGTEKYFFKGDSDDGVEYRHHHWPAL